MTKKQRPRAWNSTLPLPEKRSAKLSRSTPLERHEGIRKRNPEKIAKRKARSRKLHAAYMKSCTRKIVEARSGGRCEVLWGVYRGQWTMFADGKSPGDVILLRCIRKATDHHHKTYARYGGDELPQDVIHVCKPCHEWLDKDKPSHNRRASRGSDDTGDRE